MGETLNEFKNYLDSPRGKKYINKLSEKHMIQKNRYELFEKWLETNDFDKLIYRLILEHDDEYMDKCYHNGFEPYPNNKLSFVVDYIMKDDIPHPITVKYLECDFPNTIYEFKGYYFQHIFGQGTMLRIYNKDDEKLILQL